MHLYVFLSPTNNSNNKKPGQFPWIVFFETKMSGSTVAVCGGSLISAEYIVTAGHCCLNEISGSTRDAAVRSGTVAHIGGYKLQSMKLRMMHLFS